MPAVGARRPPARSVPRRRFCMKACPAMITLALRSCLSPRIGCSLDLRRPWWASLWFWQSRPGGDKAPRSNPPSTAGSTGAWSVIPSTGATCIVPMARWKNRRAAAASRRGDTNTSMTCPNWSIARETKRPRPATLTGDLDIGLVDLPAVADGMAAGPGGLGQQRREALDPPVEGDVGDRAAAVGEQLLGVAVRQREPQVPAHRQHDHLGREAEAGEGRSWDGSRARGVGSHDDSLPARGSLRASDTT